MARGMANGEPVVSQANTRDFEDGYSRTFGDKPIERGRWVWDETRRELVRAEDYRPPDRALDAPIMVDRFYENTTATDETGRTVDLGSRRKHAAYLKEKGYVMLSDYKHHIAKAEAKRQAVRERNTMPDPERRKVLERAFHDISEGKKRR